MYCTDPYPYPIHHHQTGRAKDVIVLSHGENVEPQPIEDAVLEKASLVDQVMCVGQDRRFLGALCVVSPKVRRLLYVDSDGAKSTSRYNTIS
jgi:long-subunit acyl-CoA synthetase (AMP-forming)